MSRGFKSVLLCLEFVAALFFSTAGSAATDPVLTLADSLKAASFYDDAVTEYRRYLFFNPSNRENSDIHARLAYCRAALGENEQALLDIDRAIAYASNDSLRVRRKLDRAVILITAEDYDRAFSELVPLTVDGNNRLINRRAGVLLFLDCIFKNDWENARKVNELLMTDGYILFDSMTVLLENASRSRRKSPSKAALLSTFVPGLGQIYNGQWLTGLHALALNAALGYLTVSLVVDESYGSAILSFVFLFQRYYEGNRQRARQGAEEFNHEIDNNYRERLLKLLETPP